MLRTDLPEIITETLPGPKAKAVIERRKMLCRQQSAVYIR